MILLKRVTAIFGNSLPIWFVIFQNFNLFYFINYIVPTVLLVTTLNLFLLQFPIDSFETNYQIKNIFQWIL